MAELKRLFASLENAELAYQVQAEKEHSSVLNQLHALGAHSHMVKHKYLTTMKDTFAGSLYPIRISVDQMRNVFSFLANLARYRDEDLRVRSANLISKLFSKACSIRTELL